MGRRYKRKKMHILRDGREGEVEMLIRAGQRGGSVRGIKRPRKSRGRRRASRKRFRLHEVQELDCCGCPGYSPHTRVRELVDLGQCGYTCSK